MLKRIVLLLALFGMGHFASAQEDVLNDAQIAKVLITINEAEIDAANVAKRNAFSPEVQDFAKMMLADHSENKEDVKKLSIGMDSYLSDTLRQEAVDSNKKLKKTGRASFDKTYLNQQVMMHEKALEILRNTLIPSAKNPELASHLQSTQDAVTEHLGLARALQSKAK